MIHVGMSLFSHILFTLCLPMVIGLRCYMDGHVVLVYSASLHHRGCVCVCVLVGGGGLTNLKNKLLVVDVEW